MKAETLRKISVAREARQAGVRLVWLSSGREMWIGAIDAWKATNPGEALVTAVERAIRSDRAVLLEFETPLDDPAASAEGPLFVHPFNPPIRLAVVGAVHVAQRLAVLARDLGYAVTVIDPRCGFLTKARFPGVTLDSRWPEEALRDFAPDARSAVVTLSHDAKIDEPALGVALRSDAFYVGALGSRRTQEARRERLREAGLDEVRLSRIHGPVGLDLGASSPAEIALSIAAEMTATLRKR